MITGVDIPDALIDLERAAEIEQARLIGLIGRPYEEQWQTWRAAASTAQAAITEYAEATGLDWYDVEQAVKRAVHHREDPAG
ncbi:hypothetical protein [Streptomyces sp. NBC_00151]|uniref:hypothetical protein n=1 Tax=Streptomyces sp. NBC_00151 TaxID=2975669 RepID=UPI002DDB559D|nr:hypothetical protein [Streptomyces sp. NBC_00151]WRZ44597.1 hypothetical protein OG915_45365 [Streptomyces sp. NBC_00151]